jgi:excisionase family DNA binding protein
MNEKVAFSPDEAAHRAGVGRTLIFSEIKRGRLEARKAGARTIITAEALAAWIKSLPVRPTPKAA